MARRRSTDAERAAIAATPRARAGLGAGRISRNGWKSELRRALAHGLPEEMAALQARAPVDLRVNTLKAARDEVLARAEGRRLRLRDA